MKKPRRRNLRLAIYLVDRSGIAAEYAPQMQTVSKNGNVVGRPRRLPLRTLLIGLLLAKLEGKDPRIENAYEVLTALVPAVQLELGVRYDDAGRRKTIEYHHISSTWNRFMSLFDTGPLQSTRRNKEEMKAKAPRRAVREVKWSKDETAGREAALQSVMDRLLEASIPDGLDHKGSYALDWTDMESLAKGRKKKDKVAADPQARWGVRTRKHNRPGKGKEPFFGYNLHFLTIVPEVGEAKLPELARRMVITPANVMAVGPLTVAMLQRLHDEGLPLLDLLIDRGYSQVGAKNLHKYLLDLVFVVQDLKQNQRGKKGTFRGAILINGEPYCQTTPQRLHNLAVPSKLATTEEWKAYWKDRDELDRYAFKRLGKPTPGMKQRYIDPAASEPCTLRCPMRPESMGVAFERDLIEVFSPPVDAACAKTKTFTMSAQDGLGIRQKYPFGSRSWLESYNRRTAVERFNSAIKVEDKLGRLEVRVNGQHKRGFMAAITAVATNMRLLASWLQQQPIEVVASKFGEIALLLGVVGSRTFQPEAPDPPIERIVA